MKTLANYLVAIQWAGGGLTDPLRGFVTGAGAIIVFVVHCGSLISGDPDEQRLNEFETFVQTSEAPKIGRATYPVTFTCVALKTWA